MRDVLKPPYSQQRIFKVVLLIFTIFFGVLWYNLLSFTHDGIPRSDDLNFYYTWSENFSRDKSFEAFMRPHAFYPQIAYKIITLLNSHVFGYDLRYYVPVAIIILSLFAMYFATRVVDTAKGFLPVVFAIFIVMAVMSPVRIVQMRYDMILIMGVLGPFLIVAALHELQGFLTKGKVTARLVVIILATALFAQISLISMMFIPFLMTILLWVVWLFFRGETINHRVIIYTFFISSFCMVLQPFLLDISGHSASSKINFDFAASVKGIAQSIFFSFGGDELVEHYEIQKYENHITYLLALVYIAISFTLYLFLVTKNKLAAAALFGFPFIAAISVASLRGSVDIPRHQVLFMFYQIAFLYAAALSYSLLVNKTARHLLAGVIVFTAYALFMRDYNLYGFLDKFKGSSLRYNQVSYEAFYNKTELDVATVRNFRCRKSFERCSEIINDIQSKRGIE